MMAQSNALRPLRSGLWLLLLIPLLITGGCNKGPAPASGTDPFNFPDPRFAQEIPAPEGKWRAH